MNAELLAEQLNGLEYGSDISTELLHQAKRDGLVIAYGYSDDLLEFEGAISDEVGAYGGAKIALVDGELFQECEDDCKWSQKARERARLLNVTWHDSDGEYAWTIATEIPHVTFDIMEEGEKFSRGIVFSIEDTKST